MKNNPKLLITLGLGSVILIFGLFWSVTGHEDKNLQSQIKSDPDIYDVASGDTNNEVLKSIVATQKTLQKKNQSLLAENRKLNEVNSQKTTQAIEESKASLQDQITKTRERLEYQFKQELKKIKHAAEGRVDTGKLEFNVSGLSDNQPKQNHIIKSVPDLSAGNKEIFLDGTNARIDKSSRIDQVDMPSLPTDKLSDQSQIGNTIEPYYTIPDGSTIANTVLASPLIGEIPVNGQLLAPAFPFKAEISYKETEDMFSANGIPLPEGISGMILQGYSVGNMSMGCTRAYVRKILFVFEDGHYVVYPSENEAESHDATQVYPKNTLGYLSDYYNNPCISGEYLTNAPKVIASLTAFGAAAGAGGAIAKAQTATLTNAQQSTTIFDGSVGKFAAGYGIGEGARSALEWYKARVHDVFDAIFVPSSVNRRPTKLIFNVTKTIPIDLNNAGRRLSYEHTTTMSATDTSFN